MSYFEMINGEPRFTELGKIEFKRRLKALKDKERYGIRLYYRGYLKNKRRTDIQFRIAGNLRNRLYQALKGKKKEASAVRDLGCTLFELRKHLEIQFKQGMSWSNYGLLTWHIDHRRPLAAFDLTNAEQLKQACHYTNLQPMWAKENISKGCR